MSSLFSGDPTARTEKNYRATGGLWLNLGSGQRPFSRPWVNVDCQERWKPDLLVTDARRMPYGEPVAELIVLHQVLEHLDCTGGPELLRECRRIMLPGASLLVFVPDLVALAKRWLEGGIDDYTYAVNLHGAFMGDEADRHKWGYSYRSLLTALMASGFRDVRLFNWREIPGADLARDFWILGVEATRP